jgi:hypothetical protein
MGVRGVLAYCADYHCSHSVALSADRWPDDLRLSEISPLAASEGQRFGRTSTGAGLWLPRWAVEIRMPKRKRPQRWAECWGRSKAPVQGGATQEHLTNALLCPLFRKRGQGRQSFRPLIGH